MGNRLTIIRQILSQRCSDVGRDVLAAQCLDESDAAHSSYGRRGTLLPVTADALLRSLV